MFASPDRRMLVLIMLVTDLEDGRRSGSSLSVRRSLLSTDVERLLTTRRLHAALHDAGPRRAGRAVSREWRLLHLHGALP